MKRVDLEGRLAALGWKPTGAKSGANHAVWVHPKKSRRLFVPMYELLWNSVAEALLAEAER